jgi:hypothetical protein
MGVVQASEGGRYMHFVGTFKADGAEGAMAQMLDTAEGFPIVSVSDGETGEREWWIGRTIWRQFQNPDLELVREGDNSDYEHTNVFGVKEGHELTPEAFRLDYDSFVPEALAMVGRMRTRYDRPELALQVGVPSALDHLYTLGFDGRFNTEPLQHLAVVEEAVGGQIRKIGEQIGTNGLIQIESPAALVTTTQVQQEDLPAELRVPGLAGGIVDLVKYAPKGTRFGIHLCLGDMNNKSQTDQPLMEAQPVVDLVNELSRQWPEGYPFEYVHFPVAGGDKPPVNDPDIYEPLGGMNTPTRIFAGIVHEGATEQEQVKTLELVEGSLGQRVGISTACGIARSRTDAQVATALDRMRFLAAV